MRGYTLEMLLVMNDWTLICIWEWVEGEYERIYTGNVISNE